MKKRFSEEQIIGILKEQEAGFTVKDIIRRHGIAEQTFFSPEMIAVPESGVSILFHPLSMACHANKTGRTPAFC
jgi:hypothetical protein